MRHTTRRWPMLAAALVATAAVAGLPWAAEAADKVEFTIADGAIAESSGLTRDTNSNLYWTVNDSEDQGVVYGLSPDGRLRGTFRYRAAPLDVEAVAMAGSRLYVGDIGDNAAQRELVTVYYFEFPTPSNETVSYQSYDFSYPDGAHDAETLVVDGTGRLFIVTKEAQGGIYAAPPQPSRTQVNTLERVGDAPAFVTDGAFLADGTTMALRTYLSMDLLAAPDYRVSARAPLPLQPQGESVALSLDGSSLLVGSEGVRSKVYRVGVPSGMAEAPAGGASPPPTGAASPPAATASTSAPADPEQPDPEQAGDPDPNAGRSRAGTFLALGLAAAVALVAGVVVAMAPKR